MKKRMKSIVDKILDPRHFKTSIYLHGAAIKAFDNGHYLESAIIYFQLVEFSLRLAIHLLSIRMGLSESVISETVVSGNGNTVFMPLFPLVCIRS